MEFDFQVVLCQQKCWWIFDIFQFQLFVCLRVMKHFYSCKCKRAANKMCAKYDRLREWLSKERSAYTPEAFAVHRTARDNTRKRVRYVMVRWRDSSWGGICGFECLVPKCLRASRYWRTPSNVCLVISRYLRRLKVLLELFPSVLSPYFRRPLGRVNLHWRLANNGTIDVTLRFETTYSLSRFKYLTVRYICTCIHAFRNP